MGREKDTDRSHTQPSTHQSPSGHDSSEGLGCSPHWVDQTIETETAIRSGWLANTDVGPRVRGRETMQKITMLQSPPASNKGFYKQGICPSHPAVAHLAARSSLGRLKMGGGKKKLSNLSSLNSLQLNPRGRTVLHTLKLATHPQPWPTHPPSIAAAA